MAGRRSRDDGVSLIEVLVAITLIGVVMTAVTSFFIRTIGAAGQQRGKQIATHLADSAMERVRALKGSSIADGRRQLLATDPTDGFPGNPVVALPTDTAWRNEGITGTAALLPVAPELVTVAGIGYQRYWYVGECRMPGAAGLGTAECVTSIPATNPTAVRMFRVVVAVTWKDDECTAGLCRFSSSSLVSAEPDEPVFNENETAPSPVIENPGDQQTDVGTAVDRTLSTSGGAPPVTVSGDNLPPGLTLSSNGRISGTPTTRGVYPVVLRVTDIRGRIGTTSFTWTIYSVPRLTSPGNQTTAVGVSVNLPVVNSGPGEGTVTWAVTGVLPTGLTFNTATGVFSGTLTLVRPATSITVRATDSRGKVSSVTFTWTVINDWYVAKTANKTSTRGTAIGTQTVTAVGGQTPYTWTVTGLPPGLSMNPTTGQFTGTPSTAGVYAVTVTARDARLQIREDRFNWHVKT